MGIWWVALRGAALAVGASIWVVAFSAASWACTGISAVSPSSGSILGGTVVTITGDGFSNCTITSAVLFGGKAASFTVNSDTQITATVPPGTGTVDVTAVINNVAHTKSQAFTYINTESPKLDALQAAGTQFSATTSAGAITGAVGGAIGNAFSGGGAPFSMGAGGMTVNFAAEARPDPRVEQAFGALAYAGNAYKAPPRAALREWFAWGDVRGTGFDRNDAVEGTRGHQLNVTAGLGRMFAPNLLLGVFTGYEKFNFTMTSIAGTLTGDGGTIGGYAGWRFAPGWRADVILGWSSISYAATAGIVSGSFNGSRWLASGGIGGSFDVAAVVFEPSARLHALWERDGSWTDTLGAVHGSRDFSVGRFSAGGKATRPWRVADGIVFSPYAGFYADWRFSSDSALPVNASSFGIKDGLSGRATAGLSARTPAGVALSIGGELGGLGAGYEIWSLYGRAGFGF